MSSNKYDMDKYYIADPMLAKANFAEYLEELTFNDKTQINKITLFVGANKHVKRGRKDR